MRTHHRRWSEARGGRVALKTSRWCGKGTGVGLKQTGNIAQRLKAYAVTPRPVLVYTVVVLCGCAPPVRPASCVRMGA